MNRPDTTDLAIDRWRRLGEALRALRMAALERPDPVTLSRIFQADELYADLDRSLMRRALEETH